MKQPFIQVFDETTGKYESREMTETELKEHEKKEAAQWESEPE